MLGEFTTTQRWRQPGRTAFPAQRPHPGGPGRAVRRPGPAWWVARQGGGRQAPPGTGHVHPTPRRPRLPAPGSGRRRSASSYGTSTRSRRGSPRRYLLRAHHRSPGRPSSAPLALVPFGVRPNHPATYTPHMGPCTLFFHSVGLGWRGIHRGAASQVSARRALAMAERVLELVAGASHPPLVVGAVASPVRTDDLFGLAAGHRGKTCPWHGTARPAPFSGSRCGGCGQSGAHRSSRRTSVSVRAERPPAPTYSSHVAEALDSEQCRVRIGSPSASKCARIPRPGTDAARPQMQLLASRRRRCGRRAPPPAAPPQSGGQGAVSRETARSWRVTPPVAEFPYVLGPMSWSPAWRRHGRGLPGRGGAAHSACDCFGRPRAA